MENTADNPIRLLLVDDNTFLRQHLRGFLDAYPDIEVVGEAADGEEALRSVQRLSPHVVVIDVKMPRLNGIAATARIRKTHPHVAVVGLSMDAEHYRKEMIEAGASAVIPKEDLVKQLYEAILLSVSHSRPRDSLPPPTRGDGGTSMKRACNERW